MGYIAYIAGFLLFIMATFVNDYDINGFPAFYIIWLAIIVFRLSIGVSIKSFELAAQITLLVLVLPPVMVEFFNSEGVYIHSYIIAVLYINVVFLLPYFLSNNKLLCLAVASLLSIIAIFSLSTISQGGGRSTIYFGPNVLYRIYGVLFSLLLMGYFYENKYFLNKPFFWLVFSLFVIGLAATGSRGAIMVFAATLGFLLMKRKAFKIKMSHILFFMVPALGVLTYVMIKNVELFWRLFYFDFENNSIVARLGYFDIFIEHMRGLSLDINYLFGMSSTNPLWSNYPHNVFMEAFVNGGLWLFFLIVISFVLLIYRSVASNNTYYFTLLMIYLPIFVGACVSGNLIYNFPVLTVPFLALFYTVSKKQSYTYSDN